MGRGAEEGARLRGHAARAGAEAGAEGVVVEGGGAGRRALRAGVADGLSKIGAWDDGGQRAPERNQPGNGCHTGKCLARHPTPQKINSTEVQDLWRGKSAENQFAERL